MKLEVHLDEIQYLPRSVLAHFSAVEEIPEAAIVYTPFSTKKMCPNQEGFFKIF